MPVLMKDNEIYKQWSAWCVTSNNKFGFREFIEKLEKECQQ